MSRLSLIAVSLFLANASAGLAQDATVPDQGSGGVMQGNSGNAQGVAGVPQQGNEGTGQSIGGEAQGSGGVAQGNGGDAQGSGGAAQPNDGGAAQGNGSAGQGDNVASQNSGDVTQGRKCFDEFTSLVGQYDPRYFAMINDDAKIQFTTISPDGTTKDVPISASQYKQNGLALLQQKKNMNNQTTYSDIDVKPEGSGYRVNGTVHVSMTGANETFSGLVTVDSSQNCHIEEIKESIHSRSGANASPN